MKSIYLYARNLKDPFLAAFAFCLILLDKGDNIIFTDKTNYFPIAW